MHADLSPLVELAEVSASQKTRLSVYHVIGDATENNLHKTNENQPNTESDPSFPRRCFLSKFHTNSKVSCVTVHTALNKSCLFAIVGNDDNSATIWNLRNFTTVRKLQGIHKSKVRAISTFKSIIATASDDKTVAIWDFESGQNLLHLTGGHEWYVTGISIFIPAPHSVPMVVSCSFDTVAVVWNSQTGEKVMTFTGEHSSGAAGVSTCDCSQSVWSDADLNCHLLVTAGFDKKAVVWNAVTGRVLRKLEGGHNDFISHGKVVCLPVCPVVVTTSFDNTAAVWSLLTGEIMHKLVGGHTDWITSLDVYLPDVNGERPLVLTGGHDGRAVLWDLSTGKMVRVMEGTHSEGPLSEALFLPKLSDRDMYSLANGSSSNWTEGLIVLSAAENGTVVLCDLQAEQSRSLRRHTNWVTALCVFSIPSYFDDAGVRYDEVTYVVSGSVDKTMIVWDLRSGDALQQWTGQHTDSISGVDVYIPHGERGSLSTRNVWIVSVGFDRQAVVWDLLTGRVVRVMPDIHSGFIASMKIYNPSPKTVQGNRSTVSICVPLILTASFDHSAALWNLFTGQLVFRLSGGHSDYVSTGCLYDSGDFCTSMAITGGCDNSICYWDISTGRLLRTISDAHAERIKSIVVYVPKEDCRQVDASPKLVSGSYDKCAVIWDLLSGQMLFRLAGMHSNWVTAVAVCGTSDGSGDALVFTGSFDGSTVLWDLHTGRVVRKMECDHSDSIRTACTIERSSGPPIILTASNDFTVGITDTLYPLDFMPPQFSVRRAFDLDAQELHSVSSAPWPRIAALSCRYKVCLWRDNPSLFLWATLLKRSDFFTQFQHMLKEVITLVKDVTPGVSLLRYLITTREIDSLRIVLAGWAANCNLPLRNCVLDRHASHFISKEELVLLAREYPSEFVSFVCSLKLVNIENHRSLFCTIIDASRVFVIGVSDSHVTDELWTALPSTSSLPPTSLSIDADSDQPATLMYLPMVDASNIVVLDAFVTTCRSLGSVDLFDSEAGIIALRYAWDSFGCRAHYTAVGKYIFILVVFTVSCLSFDELVHRTLPLQALAWTNVCLVIYGVSYRMYVIHLKLLSFSLKSTRAMLLFATDVWNVVDMVSLPCMLIGTLLRCVYRTETSISRCFLAVASVSLWFKSLYFLRPLPSSGPLVSMILQIGFDIRFFLIVLGMALCGFAQGFWLLSYPNDTLAFGSISSALLNSFMYMLGQNVDSDFSGTASPAVATLLLVLFLMFMMILMLNLLIALMGQSFSAVSDKGLAQWRLEQAIIILDQMFMTPPQQLILSPYVYVLRYSSDLDKSIETVTAEESLGIKLIALENRVNNVATAMDVKMNTLDTNLENQLSDGEVKMESRMTRLESQFNALDAKLDLILTKLK